MGKHVEYVEQGVCAACGSGNVKPLTIIGGRPGENILILFECNECQCKYLECYEYTCKGINAE